MCTRFKKVLLACAMLSALLTNASSFQTTVVFRSRSCRQNPVILQRISSSPTSKIPRESSDPSPKDAAILCDDPTVVAQRVFATDKRPVILFDGVCSLCNGAVNTALDWDPSGKLRFSALQSNVGKSLLQVNGRAADDITSIVLVTQDGAYTKSDAILRITEALTPLRLLPLKPAAVLGRWVIPRFLRDLIYDGVANNRYDIMGKRNECRFDAEGEFEDRFIDDDIALKQT